MEAGWIAVTAVRLGRASYFGWLRARLDPDARLVASTQVSPPEMSDRDYYAALAQRTASSRSIATLVALRAAGYGVQVGTQGLLVENVQRSSPALPWLRPGDVILTIDDRPVANNAERDALLREREGDQNFRLEVLREGATRRIVLPIATGAAPTSPLAGVSTSSYVADLTLPFPVAFGEDGTLGGSAGLMTGLALFDLLTPGDLTRGHRVAGTGTLSPDGRVGPIGGVEQKLEAAEQHGVDVFLVPREDAEAARQLAPRARVIPVSTFEDALAALDALDAFAPF